jgi:hypothetical protein
MNYDHLSARELIHYLDLYSEDPVVIRLVSLLKEESLVGELVEAGMDEDSMTFKADWQNMSPGEYIKHLENDVDYYVRERDELEQEKEHLEQEVNRLSTISLVKFIGDVSDKLDVAKSEMHRAQRIAENEKKLRQEAEQKFEFWEKLNHGVK